MASGIVGLLHFNSPKSESRGVTKRKGQGGNKMAEIPEDMKRMLFGRGAKQRAWLGMAFSCVTWVSLILGIVGDAANKKLGLEPTSWFLIAVGFVIATSFHWFMAYYAAKEGMK